MDEYGRYGHSEPTPDELRIKVKTKLAFAFVPLSV